MDNKTTKELMEMINSLGTIKEILDSPELIQKIINTNSKHLIYVFVEMINHELAISEITHKDLINLRDNNIILTLIQNNEIESLMGILTAFSYINDADTQIMLYTNPVILNYIASNEFNMDILNILYLDTRISIIKELIKMRYNDKAYLIAEHVDTALKREREYCEEKEKSIPKRW